MPFISRSGEYYEGDREHPTDIEVPQRPSVAHKFIAGVWVEDESEAAKRDIAAVEALQKQLTPRLLRDLVLALPSDHPSRAHFAAVEATVAALRAKVRK